MSCGVRAKTLTSLTSRTYIWEVPNVREVPNDSDFWSLSFRPGTKTRTSKVRVVRDKRIHYKISCLWFYLFFKTLKNMDDRRVLNSKVVGVNFVNWSEVEVKSPTFGKSFWINEYITKFHVYDFISSSWHLRSWMTDGFWTVKWGVREVRVFALTNM